MKKESVIIKGAKWVVKYVHDNHPSLEGNDGICDKDTRTIFISENPSHRIRNVYWHEYGHAFLYECGIRDLDPHFEHVFIENMADLLEELENELSIRG